MKVRAIWLAVSFVFMLAGCGPSQEDLTATVESQVQISVEETIRAIPTLTPYPTYTPYPTVTPYPTASPISEVFINQLLVFLQALNGVGGATAQGVTYLELTRLVNEARGEFDLALALWPERVESAAKLDFEKAFLGWDLALYLWGAELDDSDNPVEPDVNRYREFVNYAGDELIYNHHPSDFIVPAYQGKKYVVFNDYNVGFLLRLAAEYADEGQSQVIGLIR